MSAINYHNIIFSRVLSVISTVLMVSYFNFQLYYFFITVLAFTHTIISFRNTVPKFLNTGATKKRKICFFIFLTLAFVSAFSGYPEIPVFFALHHILSEVYIYDHNAKSKLKNYYVLSIVVSVNTFTALVFLKYITPIFGLIVIFLCFIGLLLYLKWAKNWHLFKERVFFEGTQLVFVLWFTFINKFSIIDLLTYHFMFWFFYPVLKEKGVGNKLKNISEQVVFIVSLASVSLFFYPLYSPDPRFFDIKTIFSLFTYTEPLFWIGSFHIVMSFILSNLNPSWVRYFYK